MAEHAEGWFRAGSAPFGLVAADPRRARLAAESIGFFYRVRPGRHPRPQLTLSYEAPDALPVGAASPPPAATLVELLDYPSHRERGARWRAGPWDVVALDGTPAWYLVAPDRRVVRVVVEDPEAQLEHFVRAVRLAVVATSVAQGFRLLHAAAVVVDGVAVALVGQPRAGKTTLMLELAGGARSAILAFDKVLLRPGAGGVQVMGKPASLGVGIGTAQAAGRFLDRFPEALRAVDADRAWCAVAPGDKARVPAAAVGRHYLSACDGPYRLGAVVFPELRAGSRLLVEKIEPAEAKVRLAGEVLDRLPGNPDWAGLWPEGLPPAAEDTAALVAQAVDPALLRVRFGGAGALDAPALLRDVVATC